MIMSSLDACVALLCFSLSFFFYQNSHSTSAPSPERKIPRPRGYILENQVTHARLLPADSTNTFTYPTLSLLLSLDAVESHSLDIGRGWIFGYGGIFGRLVGLRSQPYFGDRGSRKTIRTKLEALLRDRGFSEVLEDAWMMTMPSFLGFEGINPLTVYFCYKSGTFWLTVLEIHNTFGETHAHVLQVGEEEDERCAMGYDHQWTFRREFHVSPFNDRSGFYTVTVRAPTHPPTQAVLDSAESFGINPPRPSVRVHLHTPSHSNPSQPGLLKLTALLRPVSSKPLTASSLMLALSHMPFALLLSLPRILAQAWTLHYKKRLDVFLRPEPLPPTSTLNWGAGSDAAAADDVRPGGGVKWQDEGLLERYARGRVESFLRRRVEELDVVISLTPANPAFPTRIFKPSSRPDCSACPHLVISYLSPRLFIFLFVSPSASHALLLGSETEKILFVSSKELFISVFSPPPSSSSKMIISSLQRLRATRIPSTLPLSIPLRHPLDNESTKSKISSFLVLRTIFFLEWLEEWVFHAAHARIVPGKEPWKQWERANALLVEGRAHEKKKLELSNGSVRREE
ncbi:hypothetical protein Hypma_009308 [Hypsizygus marmoreus]|uniref:DUF1365 domain-containing protein n=1 Tax=Hypsizygus marmoreus TaxID=39966 RepID=A0A369JNH6_HYPMA|nr:hypothetical protein Hypma_009308 [Hypsizygus marmoreus]